jgi:hypothetical protein
MMKFDPHDGNFRSSLLRTPSARFHSESVVMLSELP